MTEIDFTKVQPLEKNTKEQPFDRGVNINIQPFDRGLNINIQPFDWELYKEIKANWDAVAKPLDSMGLFEELHSRIGAINGRSHGIIDKCAILVFCADNGIVAEGVSQSGQEITAICADSISRGRSCLGPMAKAAGCYIETVDVGINSKENSNQYQRDSETNGNQSQMESDTSVKFEYVRNCKVMKGTRNFAKEPAMTMDELIKAMSVGRDLVYEYKKKGYSVIGLGEMGIGNTTTSSAVASVLLKLPASQVTGKGAGLSDEGLARKISVIDKSVAKYSLDAKDVFEVLRTFGGLDIAAMTGAMLAGAEYRMPVVLDGFISMVAALCACRIQKEVRDYLIPSHGSREPAANLIAKELGLLPVINAGMALGEGTGAALMISLLRTVDSVYESSISFEAACIEQYERTDSLEGKPL